MALATNSTAPYAPPSAVLEIVNRFRRGLPSPITLEVLLRAGITESLAPRTLQALQILDLIDANGRATDTLEGLRRSPEPELRKRLADWLNAAYADVLQYIDPATASETDIRDAFRNYSPIGQQPRMVTLFTGLYAAAGVRVGEKSQASRTPRAPRPRATATVKSSRATTGISPAVAEALKKKVGRPFQHDTDIPEPLMGMLTRLPANGTGWTQDARDKFMATFGTVLDFCFPIRAQSEIETEEAENEAA